MNQPTTYQKKLLDPRWQKKRLEILQRDNWHCQSCYNDNVTLHVHHKIYENKDPWDCDDKHLITLCESCHLQETKCVKQLAVPVFKLLIKMGFLAKDFEPYLDTKEEIKLLHLPEVVLSAWFDALYNPVTQKLIIDTYLKSERDEADRFLAEIEQEDKS